MSADIEQLEKAYRDAEARSEAGFWLAYKHAQPHSLPNTQDNADMKLILEEEPAPAQMSSPNAPC